MWSLILLSFGWRNQIYLAPISLFYYCYLGSGLDYCFHSIIVIIILCKKVISLSVFPSNQIYTTGIRTDNLWVVSPMSQITKMQQLNSKFVSKTIKTVFSHFISSRIFWLFIVSISSLALKIFCWSHNKPSLFVKSNEFSTFFWKKTFKSKCEISGNLGDSSIEPHACLIFC